MTTIEQLRSRYYHLISSLPINLCNQVPVSLITKDNNWCICLYEGHSISGLKPSSKVNNPILSRMDITDTHAGFVADPFVVRKDRNWYLFFEVFNLKTQKGEIGVAESIDGLSWCYKQIVLREQFHLSYPYVFKHHNNWYMIPESSEDNTVRLYKATSFPNSWELVSCLLTGQKFLDPSIVEFDGFWWMFVGIEENCICEKLELYYSDNLTGSWIKHPMNPIVKGDTQLSRPAGRIIKVDDKILRFSQDCTTIYGRNVSAIEVKCMTIDSYVEERIIINNNVKNPYLFDLGSNDWNQLGMHHIDTYSPNQSYWMAYVDAKG